MNGIHTEAALNKVTKFELKQLPLKAEATLDSQITDLWKEFKEALTHVTKVGSRYCCR